MTSVVVLLECNHDSARIIGVYEGSKENKKRTVDLARQKTKEAEAKAKAARDAGAFVPHHMMCWYETEVHKVTQ